MISISMESCICFAINTFRLKLALHCIMYRTRIAECTLPIRSDETVTILYMKSYAIAVIRNDTIAQLLQIYEFIFSTSAICKLHRHTVHSTALRTSMQFHFLRLIYINPNNSNKSSANESRKTTTIPKLLAAR